MNQLALPIAADPNPEPACQSLEQIRFTVLGKAEPAGSKKAFAIRNRSGQIVTRSNGSPVIAVTDDNRKSRGWKNDVAAAARAEYRGELLRGPIKLTLVFYRPRPKGHYRTGRNAGQLKPDAPKYPTTKPDVLKLARGVEDACTNVVWFDDAQIVVESLEKRFGEPSRVEVCIEPVE